MKSDFIGMTRERYERLYARFLNRSPSELFIIAGGIKGKTVIDLCCGGKRLTKAAFDAGAERVLSIDISEEMIGDEWLNNGYIDIVDLGSGFELLSEPANFLGSGADAVFCQQGVNYWWNNKTVGDIARYMRPDGIFIFNTFNKCPPVIPNIDVKEYDLGGRKYIETAFTSGIGTVIHLQCCMELDGSDFDSHVSTFEWIPEYIFRYVLDLYFDDIGYICDGPATVWVARNPK